MAIEYAPNCSYHYWCMGIMSPTATVPAPPLVLIKGTEFEPEKEIEFEDDEGHTGTATTKMSTYRSSARSSPSFTDKTRYKEGWEDLWYLLLGSADDKGAVRKVEKKDQTGVYDYTFAVNTSNPQDPLFCTLYNGFAKTEKDAFRYDDCLLNELEINFSNEEAMTYTPTFAANYPYFNQQNPARVIPKTTVFTKSAEVSIYIAPFRDSGYATEEEIIEAGAKYGCYIEGSLNVNNNAEDQPCSSDEFGTSTKVLGSREAEFSLTIPWTDKTKGLEYTFMGGSKDATKVTYENDYKTVWIVCESSPITVYETQTNTQTHEEELVEVKTDYNYKTIIKIPQINLTLADSPQSGSDSKQIELEGTIMENGTDSFIETVITTDLENLHIQTSS